jgi:hypothetical protein
MQCSAYILQILTILVEYLFSSWVNDWTQKDLFLAISKMLHESWLDKEVNNLSLEGTGNFGSSIAPKKGWRSNSSSSVISIIPRRAYNIYMYVLKRVR